MSKYNTDLDYAISLIDISPEELKEIAAEADVIIADNGRSTREMAEAYYKKGQCLQKIEECRGFRQRLFYPAEKAKQDEIKALIEKALELSADMPEALMQLGKIYIYTALEHSGEGNYEKAVELYSKAILLKRDYAAAYNNRGNAYALNKDNTSEEIFEENQKKAVADFSEALRIRPDDAAYYYNRGNRYSRLKEYEKAIADYSSAIRYGSQAFIRRSSPFLVRGKAYRELKNYEKAAADFSESLRLEPDKKRALVELWQVYLEAGGSDPAVTGMVKNTKERIIKGLNLKSLEVKKRDVFHEERMYTEVIFDNGLCGTFEFLPEEFDEAMIAHISNIFDSLNTLDTSTRKTFREKWEITNGDTDWDKFSSCVNLDDVLLSEIIFYKDFTFQLKYPVPGAGEKVIGDKTSKFFIMSLFRKDLSPDYIYFENNPFSICFNDKKHPMALNGLGGKEAYISGIAETVHRFIIEQKEVEEDTLMAHFSQFKKIEILIALERLRYNKKIRITLSNFEPNGIPAKDSGEYVYYYPLTAEDIARQKAEEEKRKAEWEEERPRVEHVERILSDHNLEAHCWHWVSDIAMGIAGRKGSEEEPFFRFEIKGDEITKLEKLKGSLKEIMMIDSMHENLDRFLDNCG